MWLRDGLTKPSAWPPPRSPGQIAARFQYARMRDPVGHRVHLALALLYLLLLPVSSLSTDIGAALLLAWAIVRLPHTFTCYTQLIRDPLGWLLILWTLLTGLSVLWSPDPAQGLDELGAFRFVLTPLALWPVIDDAAWLVGAFLIGTVVQNFAQLSQQFGWFGLEPEAHHRLNGLVHPIHTAVICASATLWYLPAIFRLRGRRRWLLLPPLLVAAAGLLATGSRGPWLAVAIVLPTGFLLGLIHRPRWRWGLLALVAGAILALAAAWPFVGDLVTTRIRQAREDLAAVVEGRFDDSRDQRLVSWAASWETFRDAPLLGVGAGGFQHAASKSTFAELLADAEHAHSTYLQTLACTGLLGGLILAAIVILALLRAFRGPPDYIFAEGSLLALIMWLIAAAFDTHHLSGHMFAIFAFLLLITTPGRPTPQDIAGAADEPPRRPT